MQLRQTTNINKNSTYDIDCGFPLLEIRFHKSLLQRALLFANSLFSTSKPNNTQTKTDAVSATKISPSIKRTLKLLKYLEERSAGLIQDGNDDYDDSIDFETLLKLINKVS